MGWNDILNKTNSSTSECTAGNAYVLSGEVWSHYVRLQEKGNWSSTPNRRYCDLEAGNGHRLGCRSCSHANQDKLIRKQAETRYSPNVEIAFQISQQVRNIFTVWLNVAVTDETAPWMRVTTGSIREGQSKEFSATATVHPSVKAVNAPYANFRSLCQGFSNSHPTVDRILRRRCTCEKKYYFIYTLYVYILEYLTLYVPRIILQYVYKPTRCTKFLWLDFIFH